MGYTEKHAEASATAPDRNTRDRGSTHPLNVTAIVRTTATMGTWKFLVQREGKQSWTALEGEVMSLEPGRYRIAARAPVANTPIAIEIAVMQPDGERRNYRRSTRTNDDGLLAVIPFTDLSDGDWTLTCQTMGGQVKPETASMSWRVIEPTPINAIEVADPWVESDSFDGVDVLEGVAGVTIESEGDRQADVQADLAETTDLADRVTKGEAIESEVTPDETDEEAPELLKGEIEVQAAIDETNEASESLSNDDDLDVISNEVTNKNDDVQISPNLNLAEGESADLDAICNETEVGEEILSEPDTEVAAIDHDPIAAESESIAIDHDSPDAMEAEPDISAIEVADADGDTETSIEETQQGATANEIVSADDIGDPVESRLSPVDDDTLNGAIDDDTLNGAIDDTLNGAIAVAEAITTNVIAMPGMAAHLPIAWIDQAESSDAPVADVAGISEIVEDSDVAEIAEIAEVVDIADRVASPPLDESESSEVKALSVGVMAELLNTAKTTIESEPLPDATVPDIAADPEPPTLTTYTQSQLKLQLDRTSFTVAAGGTLTLSGQIEADTSIDPRSRLAGLHLRLRLREPQSSRVLTVRQFLLAPTAGGVLRFERSVPVPESTTSKLILGELLLCDTVPNTIDQQSFTITAGLESLLNNLSDRNRASEPVVWQKDQWSDAKQQADQPPKTTPPLIPLPPKPTLDLPGFAASPVSGIDKSQLLASLGLTSETSNGGTSSTKPTDEPASDRRDFLSVANADPHVDAAAEEDSAALHEADSTAALDASRREATGSNRFPLEPLTPPSHRNDRFVSRLNQIAHDNELTSWLNEGDLDFRNEGLPEDFSSGDLAPLTGASEVLTNGAIERDRETSQEIVLDRPAEEPRRPSFSRSSATAPATRPVLPAETSIPSPELIVPPGHLTAGRSILVRARLPELSARIYIKLWIYDRQNQALLDGPRWLTDFLPIGDGNVEGMVNLTVPYGGLDVQFEAIAVEVETDRESYKTAIERRIVPSAPPTLPLENPSRRR
jgi:hypothetical protein